jgi:predicted RNA-binding Zn-ribbon protein involved in translation (DUF1610 family)
MKIIYKILIVNKAVKMARQMNIPILGLIENMSNVVCPNCGEKISLFGISHGEKVAKEFSVPFLGSLSIDPFLAKLCDAGKIEDYESNLFANFIPEQISHAEVKTS